MPDDPSTPTDDQLRAAQLKVDLDYYRKAIAQSGVGSQPPTIYAEKYVADVEWLMGLVDKLGGKTPEPEVKPPVKTKLETELEHDKAGRVERRKP